MNRESIIKEFEEKTGVSISKVPDDYDSLAYAKDVEAYYRLLSHWLLSKVIAQGEEIEQ